MRCCHPRFSGVLLATLVFAFVLAHPAPIHADEAPRRHALYVEALGKGALWGAGYDYLVARRWSLGVVASFVALRGERAAVLSPYLGAYPVGRHRHRLFVHGGPYLVYKTTPSSVPELPDTAQSGIAAELSAGYEYRSRVLVRGYGMLTAGSGGVYPWLGISLGWCQ
jgi:hypothetical protein